MHVETIPKLILIDGISGSGKTTTCRWLEQQFRQRMIPAQAIYEEATPHRLHWWNYWDGTRHYPPDFDHVSPKTYMEISLERWRQFIAHVSVSNDFFVVEGVLYCLAVWFFLQGDTDRLDIAAYIKQVEQSRHRNGARTDRAYRADALLSSKTAARL